jgi:hypothetical protein
MASREIALSIYVVMTQKLAIILMTLLHAHGLISIQDSSGCKRMATLL